MAVNMLPKRDIVEQIIPVDNSATGSTPGTSWAWGSWVQIVSSCPNDFILTQVQLYELISLTSTPAFLQAQIQIGTGAASSEVVVAHFATGMTMSASGSAETKNLFTNKTHFVAPVRIASGTRIAIRSTANSAGFVFAAYLVGYDATDFNYVLRNPRLDRWLRGHQIASGGLVLPSAGVTTVSSAASSWGFGSWVEFIASASYPLLIKGIQSGEVTSSLFTVFEAGLGAASSEVTHARYALTGRSAAPGPAHGVSYAYRPLYVMPGERVCLRVKDNSTSAKNYDTQLIYDEVR